MPPVTLSVGDPYGVVPQVQRPEVVGTPVVLVGARHHKSFVLPEYGRILLDALRQEPTHHEDEGGGARPCAGGVSIIEGLDPAEKAGLVSKVRDGRLSPLRSVNQIDGVPCAKYESRGPQGEKSNRIAICASKLS